LYIDPNRNVGALDPYLREEHIGIGCALENLILAAAPNGYASTATLISGKLTPNAADGKPRLVARVDLVRRKPEASELYEAIPRRHTNRCAYNQQMAIPVPFLESLGSLPVEEATAKVFLFTAEPQRNKIAEISSAANSELYSDPQVQDGSDQWIRTDWSSVQKYRDGLTIDAFGLTPMATAVAKTTDAFDAQAGCVARSEGRLHEADA